MMNYRLYLDTADKYLTIGISLDDKLIYTYQKECPKRQSEFLTSEVEFALKSCNIELKDIEAIVVGIGPGSYTGVRIALAFSKVIASINNIKLIPVSSLQAMGNYNDDYVSILNARSLRSYLGIYSKGKAILEDKIVSNDEARNIIDEYSKKGFKIIGDLGYLNLDGEDPCIYNGLFTNGMNKEPTDNIDSLTPLYLKENYDYKKS